MFRQVLREIKPFLGIYLGGGAFVGSVWGFCEDSYSRPKQYYSYSENMKIRSKIVGYGALKSFQYTALPITYPLSKIFGDKDRTSFFNQSTADFAQKTYKEFEKQGNRKTF